MAHKSYSTKKGFIVGSSTTADFPTLIKAIADVADGAVLYMEKGEHGNGENLVIDKNLTITSFSGASARDTAIDYALQIESDVVISNIKLITSANPHEHLSGVVNILNCHVYRSDAGEEIWIDYSSDGDTIFCDCLFSDISPSTGDFLIKETISTSTITFLRCSRPSDEILGIVGQSNNIFGGELRIKNSVIPFAFSIFTPATLFIENSLIGHPTMSRQTIFSSGDFVISNSRLVTGGDDPVLDMSNSTGQVTNSFLIRNSTNEADEVIGGSTLTTILGASNLYFGIPKGVDPNIILNPIYTFPNSMFSPFVGDFSFESNTGGEVQNLISQNTVDSSGSAAVLEAKIAGVSSDHAMIKSSVEGVGSFGGTISPSGNQFHFYYRDDDDVTPSNATNQIFRIIDIDTVAGTSSFDIKSSLTIEASGTTSEIRINSGLLASPELSFDSNTGNDAIIHYGMGGANWGVGVDASDSNNFFITEDNTAYWPPDSINTYMKILANNGAINFPKTPCVAAKSFTNQLNVIGNGVWVTVGYDTIFFDQGGSFNPITHVYTATATGKYLISASAFLTDMGGVSKAISFNVVTSDETFLVFSITDINSSRFLVSGSVTTELVFGDEVFCEAFVGGMAGNTADILIDNNSTMISIKLVA